MEKQIEVPRLKTVTELKVEYQQPNEEKILAALKTVYEHEAQDAEVELIRQGSGRLVNEWFRLKMAGNYSELRHDIFEQKRIIMLEQKERRSYYGDNPLKTVRVNFEIPMFCCVNLGEILWKHNAHSKSDSASDYYAEITSKTPLIPREAVKEAAAAKRYCYEIYTQAMKTYPLDEILTGGKNIFPDPAEAQLKVLWFARPHELKVEVREVIKDPAIVLQWVRPYLAYAWNEDLLPIEDLLADALKP